MSQDPKISNFLPLGGTKAIFIYDSRVNGAAFLLKSPDQMTSSISSNVTFHNWLLQNTKF